MPDRFTCAHVAEDASSLGQDHTMPCTAQVRNNQPSERKRVGMWLPPPILLGMALILGAAVHRLLVGPFSVTLVRAAIGGALVMCSLLAIVACMLRFSHAGTPFRPVSPATTIVRSGLYRLSRNPMYVGMTGILMGTSLVLGSAAHAAAVLPFVILVHIGVILPEERYLERLHGASYRDYKRTVRRWL